MFVTPGCYTFCMVYIALLRGINVGGNNKVNMGRLKSCFESAGMRDVRTYLNSGNVIFQHESLGTESLTDTLEKAIVDEFGFGVIVLLVDADTFARVREALPDSWTNDQNSRCDVMFLWESIDSPDIVEQLPFKPEIVDITYVPGAVLYRIDRSNVTRSGMTKIIGSKIYKQMTVRNCNTVRRLAELVGLAE